MSTLIWHDGYGYRCSVCKLFVAVPQSRIVPCPRGCELPPNVVPLSGPWPDDAVAELQRLGRGEPVDEPERPVIGYGQWETSPPLPDTLRERTRQRPEDEPTGDVRKNATHLRRGDVVNIADDQPAEGQSLAEWIHGGPLRVPLPDTSGQYVYGPDGPATHEELAIYRATGALPELSPEELRAHRLEMERSALETGNAFQERDDARDAELDAHRDAQERAWTTGMSESTPAPWGQITPTVHDARLRVDLTVTDSGPESEMHIDATLVLYCTCGAELTRASQNADARIVVLARAVAEHHLSLP